MTKEIKLLSIHLRNFKGASDLPNPCKSGKNLNLDFGDITRIEGDNGTLKSTIFDAFTFLLFGKNSADNQNFGIKTIKADKSGPYHKLEHDVWAILSVDSRHVKLRRLLKEKWVKKRGSEISEWTGHETEFFIDDVPKKASEYNEMVEGIIQEDLAKLITNPLYFNSTIPNRWTWVDRRRVLDAMAGTIDASELMDKIATLQNKQEILNLTNELNSSNEVDLNRKIEAYRKKISSKKKLIKENLETTPTRIDEAKRSTPVPQDYDSIEFQIKQKQGEIEQIESSMQDKTHAYQKEYDTIQAKQRELSDLKVALSKAEVENRSAKANELAEIDGKIRKVDSDLRSDRSEYESLSSEVSKNRARIAFLNEENNKLRDRWTLENEKQLVIDEHKYNCPTCKQSLPEDQRTNMVETLTANFNSNKKIALKEIDLTGQHNKAIISELEQKNEQLTADVTKIELRGGENSKQLAALKEQRLTVEQAPVAESKEAAELKKKIEGFVIPASPVIDNSELKSKKAVVADEIDSLKAALSTREQIEKLNARVAELEAEEKRLSQELANLERTEFTIDAFSKAKIETIESRINGKFQKVRFKMFEQQINGGEVECCECMVDGVPYSDVNTAGKINAGIDIINALTDHYGVNAPVWIDNRESTIRILPCKSQIINLVAVKDAKLTVTSEQAVEYAAA